MMDKMSQGDQPILNWHKVSSNLENRAKWLGPFFFQNFLWDQERVPIFPFVKSWLLVWSFILDQIDLALYVMSLLIRLSNCYRHTCGDACKGKFYPKLFSDFFEGTCKILAVIKRGDRLGYSKTWRFTSVPLKSSETGFLMISGGVELINVLKFA